MIRRPSHPPNPPLSSPTSLLPFLFFCLRLAFEKTRIYRSTSQTATVTQSAQETCAEFDHLCSEYEVDKLLRKKDAKPPLPAAVGALNRALPKSHKMYGGKKLMKSKSKSKKKAPTKGTHLDPDETYARHKFVSLSYKEVKRQAEIKGTHPNETKETSRLARTESAIERDAKHRPKSG